MAGEGDPKVADDLKVPKAPGVPLPRVPFEIRFLDYEGNPLSARKCTLDWRSEKLPGTTDQEGVVKFHVPTFQSTGTLSGVIHVEVFPGQPTLDMEVVMLLQMPPADQVAGVKARLANLGYLDAALGQGTAFGEREARALDRFRFAHRIVDAKTLLPAGASAAPFDPATKNRLESVHDTRTKFVAP